MMNKLKEPLQLKGKVNSALISGKRVIIEEEVIINQTFTFEDCDLVFDSPQDGQANGNIYVQNGCLRLLRCSISSEMKNKQQANIIRLQHAELEAEHITVRGIGAFIETDENSKILLSKSNFEELEYGFIKETNTKDIENLVVRIIKSNFSGASTVKNSQALFQLTKIKALDIKGCNFEQFGFPLLQLNLFSTKRKIEITETTFNKCLPAEHLMDISGGFGTTLLLKHCNIYKCSSLKFADDPIEIIQCQFEDCSAIKSSHAMNLIDRAQGGAICFESYDYGKIENCRFKNCNAVFEKNDIVGLIGNVKQSGGDGGAIYIDVNPYHSKKIIVDNCEFISCEAGDKGGAICINQDGKSKMPTVMIDSCRFFDCTAKTGPAIHYLSVVSGDYKWNTKERPFISAKISNAFYENCESVSDEAKGNYKLVDHTKQSAKEDLFESAGNVTRLFFTLMDAAETVIKQKGKTAEERQKFLAKIEELEHKILSLKNEDPEALKRIEQKIEELWQNDEALEIFEEIKDDFKEFTRVAASELKSLFE